MSLTKVEICNAGKWCKMNSEAKKKRKITVLCVLIAAVMLFIWCNSLASIEESAELSSGMLSYFLKAIVPDISGTDFEFFHNIFRKCAHFTEFFVLGTLLTALKATVSGKMFDSLLFMPLFVSLLVADIDEFIQLFVGRGSQVQDVMIDFAGAVTGIAFMLLVISRLWKRRSKKAAKSAAGTENHEENSDISLNNRSAAKRI